MSAVVLLCGNVFDGISDALTGPAEILVEDNQIWQDRSPTSSWVRQPAAKPSVSTS
jgi:hypothetical protein